MPKARASLLIGLFLAACNSTSTGSQNFALTPLSSLGSIDLDYEGSLSSQGMPHSTLEWLTGEEGEIVSAKLELFLVDESSISVLYSEVGAHLRAERIDVEAAQRIRDKFGSNQFRPDTKGAEIELRRGGTGGISTSGRMAYVDSFDLRNFETTSIGDPVVATAKEGFRFELTSHAGKPGTPCKLNMELFFSEVTRPIAETSVKLPGSKTSVTIQTPVYATQIVRVDTEFDGESTLIVGPIPSCEGRDPMIALFTLRLKSVEDSEGAQAADAIK